MGGAGMGRRRVLLVAACLAALLALVVAGCSGPGGGDGGGAAGGDGRLRVVATTTQVADLAAYTRQLQALDAEVERRLASLANRKVVTNHDAFGYYLDRYGLQLVGSVIPSFDSSAELSGRDIRDLVARIRATGVKAVFSETSLPPRAAETIAHEAGVKVVEGEDALYGDSLGPAGSDGDTYLKMVRHNTRTIVSNLSGA